MAEITDLKAAFGAMDFTPAWAKSESKVNVGKVREERARNEGGERGERGERPQSGEKRPPFKKFDRPRAPRQFVERERPLDVEIKILPDTKALGTIIRKLQGDFHAYKLKDLAYFFLDNPSSILLKVQAKDRAAVTFHQCKACGFATTDEAALVEHIVTSHIGEYFDSKEVEVEPPKGNFNCVAKCGLSGVLLGPPNIHEFNATIKEMIRTRYPDMSEQEYRSRIEMVRDAEQIEAWRKSATKKTLFFAKGMANAEGAQGFTREQAEGEFRRNYLAPMMDVPKALMISAEQALKSPIAGLRRVVEEAIGVERRQPFQMCFALRGAFHHRKLKFIRVNDARGSEFVLNGDLKEFDAEHAIPELASTWKFLVEHPCLDKTEFPTDITDFEKQLQWLVSTGHAVAFTNGVFSAAEKFPKYGPQWKKRASANVKAAEVQQVKAAEVQQEEKKDEIAPVVAE